MARRHLCCTTQLYKNTHRIVIYCSFEATTAQFTQWIMWGFSYTWVLNRDGWSKLDILKSHLVPSQRSYRPVSVMWHRVDLTWVGISWEIHLSWYGLSDGGYTAKLMSIHPIVASLVKILNWICKKGFTCMGGVVAFYGLCLRWWNAKDSSPPLDPVWYHCSEWFMTL